MRPPLSVISTERSRVFATCLPPVGTNRDQRWLRGWIWSYRRVAWLGTAPGRGSRTTWRPQGPVVCAARRVARRGRVAANLRRRRQGSGWPPRVHPHPRVCPHVRLAGGLGVVVARIDPRESRRARDTSAGRESSSAGRDGPGRTRNALPLALLQPALSSGLAPHPRCTGRACSVQRDRSTPSGARAHLLPPL